MIVNGVTLPDIPDKVLELSQYYIIHRMYSDTSEIYSIRVLPNAAVYFPPGMITEYGTLYSPEYYTFNLSTDGNEWIDAGSGVGELAISIGVADGVTDELLFSNHDIYEVTSVNAETGEFTTGEIYFPNSEAEQEPEEPETQYAERYSILGSILVGTARQIMRLTDSTKKVKPEEFEPKLEGINIQLQELTVTATEEVQTITPPSGVYGFSKVIVEAVEDSGSTGGGGTGEGGDDISYPSASGTTFGTESVVTEKETGNTKYGDETLQTVPNDNAYAYTIIYTNSDKSVYWADHYAAPLRLTLISGNKYYFVLDENSAFVSYKCEGNNGWKMVSSGSKNAGNTISYSYVLWANFPFVKNGETVQEFPEAVPEMETTIEERPVEREDSYIIGSDDLNAMISAAQKITGSVDPMTPGEAAEALEEYYASLNTETTE